MSAERSCRFLAHMTDPERVNQAREIVAFAALDLFDDVAANLAKLARHGPLRPRFPGRDDEIFELRHPEMVQIREVTHQPALDELIDERFARSEEHTSELQSHSDL